MRVAPVAGSLAGAVIVFAACGTAASPSPSATAPASQPPAASEPPAGSASPGAEVIDLTNTEYEPEAGQDGGQIIIGDWQEANQFNPFYVGQVTEANVASAVWYSPSFSPSGNMFGIRPSRT